MTAQNTVGTIQMSSGLPEGYVLFQPNASHQIYIIDRCGRVIRQWENLGKPGQSVYFMPNGDVLGTQVVQTGNFIAGGIGGKLNRFNWEGELVWTDSIANDSLHLHHDIAPLPNGNILAIAWQKFTAEEAIARGRLPENTPDYLWITRILELQPLVPNGSEVVWSWSPWDHLIQNTDPELPHFGEPEDYPNRFDVNFEAYAVVEGIGVGQNAASDWLHVNSIFYDENRDEIILSSRNWNEIWIIDHSTSPEESQTSSGGNSNLGGQILWRWGNPQSYGRGDSTDQVFFHQHDARLIQSPAGSVEVSVFNNGYFSPNGEFSYAQRVELPLDMMNMHAMPAEGVAFLPEQLQWSYPAEPDSLFFSRNISGYTRYQSDHNLISIGTKGRLVDVNDDMEVLWEYVVPTNWNGEPFEQGASPIGNDVFRAEFIPTSHPGLEGRDLEPGNPIELNPSIEDCLALSIPKIELGKVGAQLWPNPAHDVLNFHLTLPPHLRPSNKEIQVDIYSVDGQLVAEYLVGLTGQIHTNKWKPGMYFAVFHSDEVRIQQRMLIQ
jgi:hypothetical protein